MLCEFDEEWRALYREGRGEGFGHIGGFGWEICVEFLKVVEFMR